MVPGPMVLCHAPCCQAMSPAARPHGAVLCPTVRGQAPCCEAVYDAMLTAWWCALTELQLLCIYVVLLQLGVICRWWGEVSLAAGLKLQPRMHGLAAA